MSASIDVRPILGRGDMRTFIDLPWKVYADDPVWVPPLRLERRMHFSRLNPFLKHAEWQGWVAWRDGIPVGRISAQVDFLHRDHHGLDSGHFGLFETEDDDQVAAALLEQAESWLSERGTSVVTGPFNFSINQDCGILVEGFGAPPVVMMPHARPWYGRLLEQHGYLPAKDLLSYRITNDFEKPQGMVAVIRRYERRIKVRKIERRRFAEEMEQLRDIFNDAWADNWGFVPFTREEFAEVGSMLRWFITDDFIQIAEFDDEPVAFIVALPDLNEVFAELNGSLFPFGWLQILKRTLRYDYRGARVPLMGVRRQFRNKPLGAALALAVCERLKDALKDTGIQEIDMSWILEDNKGMRDILEGFGSKIYKRYRLYEKSL